MAALASEAAARIETPSAAPRRVFKLATTDEYNAFIKKGRIESSLDEHDGFIHLSDKTSPKTVAKLFFTTCSELKLIELDSAKLPGKISWIIGQKMVVIGCPAVAEGNTMVQYIVPDGCVHVYGSAGVPTDAIVRVGAAPLVNGTHVFPSWLNEDGDKEEENAAKRNPEE